MERDYLKAEQRERERERTSNGRVQEGEWEKRYWEVVEEKKGPSLFALGYRFTLVMQRHGLISFPFWLFFNSS